jgi:polysaccharide pyruvyl transferase WcaK-like protein
MALKEVLEKKNNKVDIINFSSKEQQKLYSAFYKKLTVKNIVKNFLCIPGRKVIRRHYEQYAKFIAETFELKGTPYETTEELKKNLPRYDMLIAGGDQVWNVNVEDFATAYFLDFADDTYKISYSPSLGATDINQSIHKEKYNQLLQQFNAISCREVNGKKSLEKLTGREVELLLDPTMLLTKEEWLTKINVTVELPFSGEYIFYYAFSYSPENNQVIQKIAEENNLTVVVIDSKQWYIKGLSKYKNFVLCDETGPEAFIKFMKESKYVITTSFHGTVFSLVFHKKFIYINGNRIKTNDDRTSFILEQMDLMNKFIHSEEVTIDKLDEVIDYSLIDFKVSKLREKASDYLDDNIDKASTFLQSKGKEHKSFS